MSIARDIAISVRVKRILVFIVVFVATLLLLDRANSGWAIVLAVTAPWWLGPILAKRKIRFPVGTRYDRIALSDIPGWARTHLDETGELLAPLGFSPACVLRDANARWTAYIALFEREADATGALAMSADLVAAGQRRRIHQVDVFTNLVGMGNVTASDSGLLPKLFPNAPTRVIERFPGISAARLAHALDALVRPHAGAARVPMQLTSDGAAYLNRNALDQYEEYAAAGYARRSGDGAFYLGTWKGAFVATWRLAPPTKQLLMARTRRHAAALLARLGV